MASDFIFIKQLLKDYVRKNKPECVKSSKKKKKKKESALSLLDEGKCGVKEASRRMLLLVQWN